jgi:ATP-binding cassette subfamily B multidrug efflux pump
MSIKNLLRLVFFYRFRWRLLILCISLLATLFGLAAPYFQKSFIDSLLVTPLSFHSTILFLASSFAALLASLALNGLTNYLGMREAVIMQGILAKKLFEKVLTLRTDSLRGHSVGEFVSVYATDIPHSTVFLEQSLPVGANIVFPLIIAPLALIFLFELPWEIVFISLLLIVMLNLFMAYRQSIFFFKFKKLAADRVTLVNEWIQNIRTLKILGWIEKFEEKIFSVRETETANRIAMVTNGQTMNSITSSLTFALSIGCLLLVIQVVGKDIEASTLIATLWIVGIFLTRPLRQLPWFFTFVFDSWTSLARISSFLSIENSRSDFKMDAYKTVKPLQESELALDVENLNLIIDQKLILQNIQLKIKKGSFVCIVGEVGSGKSLLLLSLLGETGAQFEKYWIGSNNCHDLSLPQLKQFFSFVPQQGFIMSSSLRDNIAFQYQTTPQQDLKIQSALSFAQFDVEGEKMPQGLDTEIGERGVNLSGGQRQRVSIARVEFLKAPIILLDDCLSALDVKTENLLLKKIEDWRDETVLMTTHRLSVLRRADWIIFLKHGQVALQGTLSTMKKNADFRDFIKQTEQQFETRDS